MDKLTKTNMLKENHETLKNNVYIFLRMSDIQKYKTMYNYIFAYYIEIFIEIFTCLSKIFKSSKL